MKSIDDLMSQIYKPLVDNLNRESPLAAASRLQARTQLLRLLDIEYLEEIAVGLEYLQGYTEALTNLLTHSDNVKVETVLTQLVEMVSTLERSNLVSLLGEELEKLASPQTMTITINSKPQKDYKQEVDGDNGLPVQENWGYTKLLSRFNRKE